MIIFVGTLAALAFTTALWDGNLRNAGQVASIRRVVTEPEGTLVESGSVRRGATEPEGNQVE
jgi:hypothetical protein